jgi:hypothetical protein
VYNRLLFIGNALDSFTDEDFILFLDSAVERFKDSTAAENPREVSRPNRTEVSVDTTDTQGHIPLPNKRRTIPLVHNLPVDITKDKTSIRY